MVVEPLGTVEWEVMKMWDLRTEGDRVATRAVEIYNAVEDMGADADLLRALSKIVGQCVDEWISLPREQRETALVLFEEGYQFSLLEAIEAAKRL